MSAQTSRAHHSLIPILLITFILASWALHLYDLTGKSLWSDEGLSVYRARKSIAYNLTNEIVVQGVVTKDTQPPLYFILLHLLRAVAGESEFALKFLSVLFAALIIPLLYVTGRHLASTPVGLIAAALGAASPTYLWYAQEMRMYTMLVALALLSTYAMLHAISESVGWRRAKVLWFLTYLGSTGAMIYTHYSGFFLLVFQGVVIVIFIISSRRWRMIGLMIIGGLAALPLLPFVLRRLLTGAERDFSFVPLSIILHDLLNGFVVGMSVDYARVIWLNVIGLGVIVIGLLAKPRGGMWGRWRQALFLAGFVLIPTLTLYAVSHIKPMYMGVRHLIVVSPAFYLALAKGLAFFVRRRLWLVGALLGLIILGGNAHAIANYYTDEAYAKDDLRSLACYIRDHFRAGDVVVLSDAIIGSTFGYYAPDLTWSALPAYGQMAGPETLQQAQELANRYERIWFVHGPPSADDPDRLVQRWMEEHLFQVDFRRFTGYGVEVGTFCYATRSPVLEPSAVPVSQQEARRDAPTPLHLIRSDLPAEATPSGESLAVTFYWWLSRPADAEYKVSVRLQGSDGKYWAQGDHEPFYFFPTTQWPVERVIRQMHEVLLPAGTPPGRYQVECRVYRPDTGETLNVWGADASPLGEGIALGEVEIGPAIRPVRPAQLPPHRRVVADWGELMLYAHTWAGGAYRAGDVLHMDVYWRAAKQVERDMVARLQLLSAAGELVQEMPLPLASPTYPVTAWRVGDLLRGQVDWTLPETLSAGRYTLRLQLLDPHTWEAPPVRAGWWPWPREWFEFPAIEIIPPATPTPLHAARQVPHPLQARLDEGVLFLGYGLDKARLRAGDTLQLTLYWECRQPTAMSLTVFTHVLDAQETIWGQKDSIPSGGARPTNGWLSGEIIVDTYEITIKPEAPVGTYQLEIGMYDAATLVRAPAFDAGGQPLPGDRILIGAIEVTP